MLFLNLFASNTTDSEWALAYSNVWVWLAVHFFPFSSPSAKTIKIPLKLVTKLYFLIWPVPSPEAAYQYLAIKEPKFSNQKPSLAHLINMPMEIKHLILSPGLYLNKLPFSYVLC